MSRQGQLKILNHPLIQHKLTLMRCTDTPSNNFRRLLKEISILMSYEVFRDLPLKNIITNTPIQSMRSPVLSEKLYVSFQYYELEMECWMGLLKLFQVL